MYVCSLNQLTFHHFLSLFPKEGEMTHRTTLHMLWSMRSTHEPNFGNTTLLLADVAFEKFNISLVA
jgi:hypothetical protein